MNWFLSSSLMLALFTCNARQAGKDYAAAAELFSRKHAEHQLAASVAGADCTVMLIDSGTRLDDATVEAIHYGTEPYDAYGGAEEFATDRRFRAVIYRDSAGRLWTYGATTRDEARSLPRCR